MQEKKGGFNPPPHAQGFPYWGVGGVAPPPSENCLSPPPRKTPPTKFLFPPLLNNNFQVITQ